MSSIGLKEYTRLKDAVNDKQVALERARGAFDQGVKQLKEDFGCDTVEEAKELLATLEKKEAAAQIAFTEKLAEYQKDYAHVFED